MERTDDNFLKVAQLRTSHEIGQKIKDESNTTRNAHGTEQIEEQPTSMEVTKQLVPESEKPWFMKANLGGDSLSFLTNLLATLCQS